MCNIDQAIRGVVGNGPLDGLKNAGEDLSKGVTSALGGIEQGIKNPLKDIEQAISGGKGWAGALDNVGKVGSAIANPVGFGMGELLKNSTGIQLPGVGGGFNPLGDIGKGLGDLAGGAGNMINGMTGGLAGGAMNALGDLGKNVGGAFQPGGAISNIEQAVTAPFKGAYEDVAKKQGVDGVDPLHELEQGISGGKGWQGAADNVGKFVGDIAPTVGNYLGAQAQADTAKRKAEMEAKGYQEMMGRAKEGEGQFLGALNEPNAALGAYQKDIQDLGNQQIGRQQNIINQQLGRSGVKGGQAANLYGRQIGELQQNGMRDINKLAYEDAANKANQKSTYFANKGQSGFNLVPKYS